MYNYIIFCHKCDSQLYKVVYIHTCGEVDNFHAKLLSIYHRHYVPHMIEIY